MGSNVISLLRARRLRRRRKWHWNPVAGHSAQVIPFPTQVRTQGFGRHTGGFLNRGTKTGRWTTAYEEPFPDLSLADAKPSGESCLATGDLHGRRERRVQRSTFHTAGAYTCACTDVNRCTCLAPSGL